MVAGRNKVVRQPDSRLFTGDAKDDFIARGTELRAGSGHEYDLDRTVQRLAVNGWYRYSNVLDCLEHHAKWV